MKPVKNLTTLILMTSSLVLLLLLQGFWLFSSYEKSFLGLRKEADGLFRNTVMALRDSSLLQFLEKLPPDSVLHRGSTFVFTQTKDSVPVVGKTNLRVSGNSSSQLSVYISSTARPDSIKEFLKPLVGKAREGKLKEGNFMIRLGPDTLHLDSIRNHYKRALAKAEKPLPFEVQKEGQFSNEPMSTRFSRVIQSRKLDLSAERPVKIFSDTVNTDWVRTDPVHRYTASLAGARMFVLKEITPQILFSVFLTLLTGLAFLLMYRSMKSQQRLMEIKNDFISNVTHELKTPVTTVSVALEALRNFKGLENPQRTEEYLNIAQSELNRLTILTDKILKTAIFENKGVSFEPEPVDLFKTMEQVLHSMKLVFEKQKAQVSFEKTGEAFTISGGSVHLTNVIYNLLDNALKYSSGEPRISISLAEHDNRVVIQVADNGIGIPKEYSKKIFEKFFRVPVGDVHNVKGYGLGLSYVDSVIRSHQGKIEVESESGQGSTFIISLPKNLDRLTLA
jgi:two-component system, OmpR family, phosphate regulon sensor histidine kinase PhoR